MTKQFEDTVRYAGRDYAITAIDGVNMFDPAAYGLRPRSTSTACWRGHVCAYEVTGDGDLLLRRFEAGLPEDVPELFGARRRRDGRHPDVAVYDGTDLRVWLTGRLLVGADVIADPPYLNMGFWPAWMYRRVYELRFDAGRLAAADDRSAEIAEVTARMRGRPRPAPTKEWVESTFSRGFDYAWPRR